MTSRNLIFISVKGGFVLLSDPLFSNQDAGDVEHGIAKNVVKAIKAEVIDVLDAPLEELEEFKTFLWLHESLFDERAFKTNR